MAYDGTKWLRANGKTVGPVGERVADLVDWVFGGIYHEGDAVLKADWDNAYYVELRVTGDLATFDGDLLTRLVVGAHDAAIRVSIAPCGARSLRLLFHPRERTGSASRRHPLLEASNAYVGHRLHTYLEQLPEPTLPSPSEGIKTGRQR